MNWNLSLAAVAAVVTLNGCGTVRNLQGNNRNLPDRAIYGGAEIACRRGSEALKGSPQHPAKGAERAYQVCAVAPYSFLVDFPLSVVADTLTLPVTFSAEVGRAMDALRYMDVPLGAADRHFDEVYHRGEFAPSDDAR